EIAAAERGGAELREPNGLSAIDREPAGDADAGAGERGSVGLAVQAGAEQLERAARAVGCRQRLELSRGHLRPAIHERPTRVIAGEVGLILTDAEEVDAAAAEVSDRERVEHTGRDGIPAAEEIALRVEACRRYLLSDGGRADAE